LSRKTGFLIGAVAVAVFLALMTYGMLSLRRHKVEVCMTYLGRTACKVATGTTEQEALSTATDNACALLAGGVTQTRECGATRPASVRWIE
jgi:hypothetical protein